MEPEFDLRRINQRVERADVVNEVAAIVLEAEVRDCPRRGDLKGIDLNNQDNYVDENGRLTDRGEREFLLFLAGAKSIGELLNAAGPDWLLEGWLATSATMVTGSPESGKSTMVASMAASVASGEPWLGSEVMSDRNGPVLIITSDPADASQWAKKGHDLGVAEHTWELISFDRTKWDVYEELASQSECKLLVFDNITSALGEGINDANPNEILAPLTRIVTAGTPVVVIHHSGKGGSKDPMGPTAYQAWRRHGVHISGRGESRTLTRSGNLGAWDKVEVRGTKLGSAIKFEIDGSNSSKHDRSPERLDNNAAIAEWIVENCQGVGVNETGKRVAEKFGGTAGSRATSLKPNGSLFPLLKRSGTGGKTKWELSK